MLWPERERPRGTDRLQETAADDQAQHESQTERRTQIGGNGDATRAVRGHDDEPWDRVDEAGAKAVSERRECSPAAGRGCRLRRRNLTLRQPLEHVLAERA